MGRLLNMEIENFKSFCEKVEVGPFLNFTAIVGENGAGKSNVMDALCFVLGMSVQKLRARNPRELIHRQADEREPSLNSVASVTLRFEGTRGDVLVFKRMISSRTGKDAFEIDGKEVPRKTYEIRLLEMGKIGHMKNFMIFQNEVESLASKSPKELTELLETLSGSGSLKSEYEKASRKLEKAESDVTFIFQKKKSLTAAKKSLSKQKDEAQVFQRLNHELGILQRKLLQFRYFHSGNDLDSTNSELDTLRKKVQEAERHHGDMVERSIEVRKELSVFRLDEVRVKRKVHGAKMEWENLQPKKIALELELKKHKDRIVAINLADEEEELEHQKENIRKLAYAHDEVKNELKKTEEEISSCALGQIDGSTLLEYQNLRAQYDKQGSSFKDKLKALTRTMTALKQRKEILKEREIITAEQVKALEYTILDHQKHLTEATGEHERAKSSLSQIDNQLSTSKNSLKESLRQREDLLSKIEVLNSAVSEQRFKREEDGNRKVMRTAIRNLARMYPGVMGFLGDLCRPTNEKYWLAFQNILGSLNQAFVVDTDKTAEDCILYMRDQRIGRGTFLPVHSLRAEAIPDRFRSLPRGACLARDIIVFDDEGIQSAVYYAAGLTVICANLEEAIELRYKSLPGSYKIVTEDGSIISKKGFITGGHSERQRTRFSPSDEQTFHRQKTNLRSTREQLEKAEEDIRELKRKILPKLLTEQQADLATVQQIERDTQSRKSVLDQKKKLASNCVQEKDSIKVELSAVNSSLSTVEARAREVSESLKLVRSNLMHGFAERNGFPDIEKFEKDVIEKEGQLLNRRNELNKALERVKSQLKYERSRNLEAKVNSRKMEKTVVQEVIVKLETDFKELEEDMLFKKERIAAITSDAEGLKQRMKNLENEDRLMKQRTKQALEESTGARKSFHTIEEDRNRLQIEKESIHRRLREAVNSAPSDPSTSTVHNIFRSDETVDFSGLSRKERATMSMAERVALENDLENQIANINKRIGTIEPNLKAMNRIEDIGKRLLKTNEEFAVARSTAVVAAREFENLKRKRDQKFNSCFRIVAKHTTENYKQLTSSRAFPNGGYAYLSVESMENSFLKGIKFSAMPPTKRFRDMDQLSGGERTIAALALLFAVQDYAPSPFLIMDEADAALDNRNVESMASFMRTRSHRTQLIVISLKMHLLA